MIGVVVVNVVVRKYEKNNIFFMFIILKVIWFYLKGSYVVCVLIKVGIFK